ncbi:DNA adenine methylase [Laribacter hongkongensis]|uniref:site-specific DNA-methyltransferase (adenine-specific) n=1 Tax=Laribacter hongkongensis TaxID=168471 RepID=A0A248LI56_9NEIS|nr:DNA adenine methylase [Laribacter hongkongensis]ASJ24322.1 site-specific DNA-adenine methylase [Laribacter hongkongensis]MCG9042003.1 DNA adenine methylase [Laribacter hongkongensis]MCG9068993.1 DNA adenine methylase [Laribacter hongkongensis]MCG9087725.1 DNA adenine methylase [Laribacter hongkongensis]MCG9110840.1 DNA adenine methylase [Laribacter hongkongensis]
MSHIIVPWLGGKRRLAKHLLPRFPEHDCYVEPFAGGAALYFLRPEPARVEVLNDLNGELVNLYRVVQHHLEEFVRQFKWAISSRQVFKWQQEVNPATLTDIQRAARFYYLQHHAFGGKTHGQTFGTATTGRPINLCRIEESLSAAHLRLSGTYVENQPWQDVMRRYDRSHTFFYCDPPYWQTAGYGVEFGLEQYQALAEFMRGCQGKVMVSVNDHPAMRDVFAGLHLDTLSIAYSVAAKPSSRKQSGELVITNW